MDSPLDMLVEILNQETALYEKMADILRQEKAATLASRLEGLHAARVAKEQLIRAISQLERQRLSAIQAIHREGRDAAGTVSVSNLIRRLDSSSARRLSRSREMLLATLKRVSDMNAENASLMAHSVKWVTGAMRLLDHLFNPQTVYHRSGRFAQNRHAGRVLNGTY